MNRIQSSRYLPLLLIVFFLFQLVLTGCKFHSDSEKGTANKMGTVKQTVIDRTLTYAGRIQPIDAIYIPSPVDGYVDRMYFSYGDMVKKNQNLFRISDPKIEQSFVDAVVGYLKNKDVLARAKRKHEGEKDMYKAGIISEDDFLKDQTDYESSYIDFAKSIIKLKKITRLVDASFPSIEKLKLGDLEAIEKLLIRHANVSVHATTNGRILSPSSLQNDQAKDAKLVTIGSKVEKGQMLAVSVDKGGYQVVLKVGEQEVSQIKKNMEATLRSIAYADQELSGKVTAVQVYDLQKGDSGGKMVFPVTVKLNKLTAKEQSKIYVGMEVKVVVHLGKEKLMSVPINAVFEEENRYWVTVLDASGNQRKVPITTGHTSARDVAVRGDLKLGDKVLLHD